MIDPEIARPLATPGADLVAAALRADLLRTIVLQKPDAFDELVEKGQPTEVLFIEFARVPIELGGQFNIGEFLLRLKQNNPRGETNMTHEESVEQLLIARTKQIQLLEGFIMKLVTALKDVRATADDKQRAIIDEALRSVGPFGS